MTFLPAVLIAGTPHSGKSVLAYRLCQALCESHIPHYLLRACPDGEGNWFHSADPGKVSLIRRKHKGNWSESFRRRISADLHHRRLPFLVDIGGMPHESDRPLLEECTHAILLRRTDQLAEVHQPWLDLITGCRLVLLADLSSTLTGESYLRRDKPPLEGCISGLECQKPMPPNPVFDRLLQVISSLFQTQDLQEIEDRYKDTAPVKPVTDLEKKLQDLQPGATRWEASLLSKLLDSLVPRSPLAVFGRAPNWVYAAIAALDYKNDLYIFGTKSSDSWAQPAKVVLSESCSHPDLRVEIEEYSDFSLLRFLLGGKRLDYWESSPFPLPAVPRGKGLVIDAPLPFWLLTAVVRFYLDPEHQFDLPWIAPVYIAPGEGRRPIITWSRLPDHPVGETYPCLLDDEPASGRCSSAEGEG